MGKGVNLGKASEISVGGMKGFVVKDHKILVSNIGGKFYAVDSLCTHVKGPLDKGSLAGEIVTCPWHGSEFNVETGEVIKGPAKTALKMYEISVENGELFINL
jgi:nitrite reductase/ring-hydroxylating ferredoxin subunit